MDSLGKHLKTEIASINSNMVETVEMQMTSIAIKPV